MNNSNNTEQSLDSLQKQRATIKGNVSRIRNMYQDGSAPTNPIDLECRLEILSSYITQIMTEIEKINSDDPKSLLLLKLGGRR